MTRKLPALPKIVFLFLFSSVLLFILFSFLIVVLKFPVSQNELREYFLVNQANKRTEDSEEPQSSETPDAFSSFGDLVLNPSNEELESHYRKYFTEKWKADESFFSFGDAFLIYPDREAKKVYGLEISGTLTGFKGDAIYVNTKLGTLPIRFSKDTSFLRLNPICRDINSLCPQLLNSSDEPLFYSVSLEYFVSSYDNISEVRILFSSLPVERQGYLAADGIIFLPKEGTL